MCTILWYDPINFRCDTPILPLDPNPFSKVVEEGSPENLNPVRVSSKQNYDPHPVHSPLPITDVEGGIRTKIKLLSSSPGLQSMTHPLSVGRGYLCRIPGKVSHESSRLFPI